MNIPFDVYHSPEFESFTLIEQSKLQKQSVLLEKDAKIIHSFFVVRNKTDTDETLITKAKFIYNQAIADFYSKKNSG